MQHDISFERMPLSKARLEAGHSFKIAWRHLVNRMVAFYLSKKGWLKDSVLHGSIYKEHVLA